MSNFLFLQTDWSLFIGRFHPLFVHLPIGFLLLAGVLEWINRRKQQTTWDGAISLSLLLGSLSGFLAAFCGWQLASEGGYDDSTLFWHRWLGIGTSVLGLVAWAIKTERLKFSSKSFVGLLAASLLMLTITGHLGGNLTHGEGYLYQYAPGFVQTIMGQRADTVGTRAFANPDSILVYTDLIRPVLEQKCFSCHGESKTQGGLNLATFTALQEGGEHGEVIEAGLALNSELVRRVTINPGSAKYMPPKGTPMTFTEISLLSWWIDQGADSSMHLTQTEVPEHIKTLLMRDYKLDTRPKPYVETANTDPMTDETKQALEKAGFSVQMLAANSNFVEISPSVVHAQVSSEQIKALSDGGKQITWLNLGSSGITDADLTVIGQLDQLTRLRIEKNEITDAGIAQLSGLEHLESLNLYGTQVSDAALEQLAKLPALKKLYLWQTQVTEQGIESLRSKRPDMMIDSGFQFAQQEVEEPADS